MCILPSIFHRPFNYPSIFLWYLLCLSKWSKASFFPGCSYLRCCGKSILESCVFNFCLDCRPDSIFWILRFVCLSSAIKNHKLLFVKQEFTVCIWRFYITRSFLFVKGDFFLQLVEASFLSAPSLPLLSPSFSLRLKVYIIKRPLWYTDLWEGVSEGSIHKIETTPHPLFIEPDTFASVQRVTVDVINAVIHLITQSSLKPLCLSWEMFSCPLVHLFHAAENTRI